MQKSLLILTSITLVLILIVPNWVGTIHASTNAADSGPQIVVVSDSPAVRYSKHGTDYLISTLGLLATIQDGQPIRFISSDTPSEILGPFSTSHSKFDDVQKNIQASITSPDGIEPHGLYIALSEAYSILRRDNASIGSTVYLVSGTSKGNVFDRNLERLMPLANRFGQDGWSINSLILPGSREATTALLEDLAFKTGGETFDLSVSTGFRRLADEILEKSSTDVLSEISSQKINNRDRMTSIVTVPPGTNETNLIFIKEHSSGTLRLRAPSGHETSDDDSTVVETPYVVIWEIPNPVPGDWRIDGHGVNGLVSLWEYSSNKLNIELLDSGPTILGQSDSLTAYVTEGGSISTLDGVILMVDVTTPEGTVISQELKDDGLSPDNTAKDGYFTATLPPLTYQGDHHVELQLSWIGFNHKVNSKAVFETQPFPDVEIKPLTLEDLMVGERVMLASVFVHIQGEPFPVLAEHLTVSFTSDQHDPDNLELVPQLVFGTGPTWEYKLFFTPEETGEHNISLKLNMEYAGRIYNRISPAIEVRSLAPLVPSKPLPQITETVSTVPPIPANSIVAESQTPWKPIAVIGGLFIIAIILLYLITRTPPHGYIYNDRNEPLVDLSRVKRKPLLGILFRNTLGGKEVGVPGLEGLAFHFAGEKIRVRTLKGQSSIRVNNEPLIGQMQIGNKTWIGAHGRLYNFLIKKDSALEPTGAGGD